MNIGKISIRPTLHYLVNHSDVEWDLVIETMLSPSFSCPNKRHGKNRFTYVKRSKKHTIELHVEKDQVEEIIWIINAFRMEND